MSDSIDNSYMVLPTLYILLLLVYAQMSIYTLLLIQCLQYTTL